MDTILNIILSIVEFLIPAFGITLLIMALFSGIGAWGWLIVWLVCTPSILLNILGVFLLIFSAVTLSLLLGG